MFEGLDLESQTWIWALQELEPSWDKRRVWRVRRDTESRRPFIRGPSGPRASALSAATCFTQGCRPQVAGSESQAWLFPAEPSRTLWTPSGHLGAGSVGISHGSCPKRLLAPDSALPAWPHFGPGPGAKPWHHRRCPKPPRSWPSSPALQLDFGSSMGGDSHLAPGGWVLSTQGQLG